MTLRIIIGCLENDLVCHLLSCPDLVKFLLFSDLAWRHTCQLSLAEEKGSMRETGGTRWDEEISLSLEIILPLAGLCWEDWRFNEKHTANNSLEAGGGLCSNLDADPVRFFYPSGNVNISKKRSEPTQPIIEFLTELQSSLLIFKRMLALALRD